MVIVCMDLDISVGKTVLAGVGGGVAATSVLHPLDLLKLRNGSQPALS